MLNPLPKHNTPSWMNRIVARWRESLERLKGPGRSLKSSRGWSSGILLGMLFVGGISLLAFAREHAAKNEGARAAAALNAVAKAEPATAKARQPLVSKTDTVKALAADKEKSTETEKSAEKERASENANAGEKVPGAAPQGAAAMQAT